MNNLLRRCAVALTLLVALCLVAWWLPRVLDPTKASPEKRARDQRWVDTSPYFWDRQLCRWASLCGLHHLREDPAVLAEAQDHPEKDWSDLRKRHLGFDDLESGWCVETARLTGRDQKRRQRERRRIIKDVPDYVLRYAPYVHLYSGEEFWPSDIKKHVQHMNVTVDNIPLTDRQKLTLDNMHQLNGHNGTLALHSRDDVESRPPWLHSHPNVPSLFPGGGDSGDQPPLQKDGEDASGPHREPTTWFDVDKSRPLHRIAEPSSGQVRDRRQPGEPRVLRRGHKPNASGYSRAPAVLVLVDKGSRILDAFWFFFYSYNLGQTVLGIRFGNHVGDWEHCMIRFESGRPRGIYFSEHEGGQAYAWEAVEKRGDRPVIYSAVDSHAMYTLLGPHPYILPFGMLKDVTDKGPLWDPALNKYAYHYDYTRDAKAADGAEDAEAEALRDNRSLVPAATNPRAPTSWFHYKGRWGDEVYSLADVCQWRLFGQYHYVTGPTGPKFKRLDRSKLCQNTKCRILYKLDPGGRWY